MAWLESFAKTHQGAYRVAVGVLCAVLTFALATLFWSLHSLQSAILIQPAVALGPTLGLFWGWPAIVGCTVGIVASEAMFDGSPAFLVPTALVYLLCNALPYLIWYAWKRKSDRPFPRFDSTGKTVLALVLFVVDALALTVLLIPFETSVTSAMDIHEARFFNSLLFMVYLGLPLLMLVERLGATPLPPRFITIPYVANRSMNLTQRLLAYLLTAVLLGVVLFIVIGGSPIFLNEEGMGLTFAENLAGIYVIVTLFSAFLFVPILFVLRQLEQQFARPAEVLTQASRDFVEVVAKHHENPEEPLVASDVPTEGTKPKHEMADLFNSTNAMRHDLVRYIDELEKTAAERERTATELSIASSIQTDAVPHDFSEFGDLFHLDVAAMLQPAREVGGDFYDVFSLSDTKVGMVIADVSGKGMPAALFMMRAMAEIREKMRSYDDVGEALTKANLALCERNDTMLFVTVFACTLDVTTGELRYANAGHNPPWVVRNESGSWLQCKKPQLVMGALAVMRYQSHAINLFPGDSIMLYTDGVTEAMNPCSEQFGNDRLEAALCDIPAATSNERIQHVLARIIEFADGAPQADDITMLAATWNLPQQHLRVMPQLQALEQVDAFLEPLCRLEGCTKKMLFDIRLALEEAFVNVANHGFPDNMPEQPVLISAATDASLKTLHVRIADGGVAYDPLAYEPVRVEAERGSDNKVGGLGILLVRSLVDSLAYERTENHNVLRFSKRFV